MSQLLAAFRGGRLAALLLSAILLALSSIPASAFSSAAIGTVLLRDLPAEAQSTYQLILQGGPMPYSRDGIVFGNRERILPKQPRGYYREYTVKTPGVRHRGARRIVCGGEQPPRPDVCFYTDDHYQSFRRILTQ